MMVKRRTLKKYIAYMTGDLFAEVLTYEMLHPDTDRAKTGQLMENICLLQAEFIRRAHKPDGKDNKTLVKEYYNKLVVDFETKIEAIIQEIEALQKEQPE